MTDSVPSDRLQSATLAFIAGFVDTCGFVALFGLFSAHVTGNFVLLGASLVQPHAGVIAKLLALPVFMSSVALTRWYLIRWPTQGRRGVLLAEAVFLALFLAAGVRASPVGDADAPLAIVAGMLAVVGLYLLLNVAYQQVIGTANLPGETLVAATLARATFGQWGHTVVSLAILLATVLATGIIASLAATAAALRTPLLSALRAD